MSTEQSIGGLVGEDFHKSIGVAHRSGAAVGGEGEFADFVGDVTGFQFFLGLADRGDLRPGVNHAGNGVVVHVPGLPGEDLGHGDALILALVRQHRAGDHVTDRVDARNVGGVVRVDLHALAVVQGDAGLLQTEALGVRTAAD